MASSRYPKCSICSYKQDRDKKPVPIYHRHYSAKQARVLQGVEYADTNTSYLCPTCQDSYYGLDICLTDSTLHEFYNPREPGVVCPPGPAHIDLVSIPGATVEELMFAWKVEYFKEPRPMRILLVAGLNDLVKGADFETFTTSVMRFDVNVSLQNRCHPGKTNSFAVAPLLPAPKLVWFPDNGPHSPNYRNRRDEVSQINVWIKSFNQRKGIHQVPGFNVLGTRTSKRWVDGAMTEFKTHRWNDWRASEDREDKLHLSDKLRVRMGQYVHKFFLAERRDKGPLV